MSIDLKNIVDITEVMNNPHFKEYLSMGFIDEIALRNAIIKIEYQRLKKKHSAFDSITLLSEKFNLSDSAINTILFRKREKKKVFLGI
ncbi:MAG: hypothetical protein R3250_07850 [Melioribacteraceae bacterium]|nr:hypothetical protein [Melioribacteraceae bacterium]